MTAPLAGLLRLQRGRSSASGKQLLGLSSLNNDILSQSCRNYRAALCTELTKPLIIRNLPSPSLQLHEVRVGVHYCGVNFADILACKGLYQEKHCLPFTPELKIKAQLDSEHLWRAKVAEVVSLIGPTSAGMEFSGMVMETGAKVSTVQEGDRVIGVTGTSAMAEECVTDQKMLWPIPEGVSYEEAAALPVSYGTAILALEHRARTQPGETVLVTAAAGATGLAAIDVAANVLKAKVIAAAGSDHKCNLALQKGAAHSVNYTQGSLKEEVKKLTDNRGVNVVLDAVGGDIFKEALHSLAWEGRIVVVGFAGGAIPSVPANLLLLKNMSALGVFWGRYREEDFPVFSSSVSSALWYCQERRIQPHVGAVFSLEEVNEAFSRITQRKSTGKVVISIK